MVELTIEYRKAAEQAAQKGDYRRAAFIYGKLLRDYRQAANVLQQGGLHHDAAILFLTKVGDQLAAARAFEAAGEIDRALQLYRQLGKHELAGDLLHRAGEDEAALAEYRVAADWSATAGDFLAAGELLLKKANRSDLALTYWTMGWEQRPETNANLCAVRLAQHYADSETPRALLPLLAEAEAFFARPGNEVAAGNFFNEVARLANRPNLKDLRDELRDRALLGLAGKLRQRSAIERRPGDLVSELLGRERTWAPAIVGDAQFAVRAATKRPQSSVDSVVQEVGATRLRAGFGLVTATGFAPGTGEVFVGFRSGEVTRFRPSDGTVVRLPVQGMPIRSLGADFEGDFVVILRAKDSQTGLLTVCQRDSDQSFLIRHELPVDCDAESWLSLFTTSSTELGHCVLWAAKQLRYYCYQLPHQRGMMQSLPCQADPVAAIVFPEGRTGKQTERFVSRRTTSFRVLLLAADGSYWFFRNPAAAPIPCALSWAPALLPGILLESVPLAWLQTDQDRLQLVGLSPTRTLLWSSYDTSVDDIFPRDPDAERITEMACTMDGYLAATLVRSGLIAGVTESEVHWLSPRFRGLKRSAPTQIALPTAVACFPSHATNELIVVCRDGLLVRVPVPKSV
jgi:hypothetical protein